MLPGWLWIDGVEVLNDSRLLANLPCQIGELGIDVAADPCPGLMLDPTNGSDLSVGVTENPWYAALAPESEDFYGFWVVEGSLNSSISRAVEERGLVRGGANVGRLQRKHRELAFEIMLVGASDAALRWGYDWLAGRFDLVDSCATSTALIRTACPTDYLDYLWELREIGIIDAPEWGDSPLKRSGCLIRQTTFTIAAGDPWRYSTEEDTLVDGETMSLNDDCDGSSTQHDFACPDELPDQRITQEVDGPGQRGQNDVLVVVDGTVEGAAAMRVRSRPHVEPPPDDPNAEQILFQTFNATDVPIGSGGFTTDDPIALSPYSAVLAIVWADRANVNAAILGTTSLPSVSGGGVTNWKSLGAGFPQTTPSSRKGYFAFIGQAGASPAADEITVSLDAVSSWTGNIIVHEITDVYVGDDPRDCMRQWVIDKKHAGNYGGNGIDGSSPAGALSWFPLQIDPTADDNHLVLAIGFHAGNPPTVTFNDSDGWEAVSPAVNEAESSVDVSWYSIQKLGLAIGENPPMFNWQPNLISTGGITCEFLPVEPDRTHRWPPTVHWTADNAIATGSGSVGRWPIDLTYDVVDDWTGYALIYFVDCKQGDDWDPPLATWLAAGFTNEAESENSGASLPAGEHLMVIWERPTRAQTAPTAFPAAIDHLIVGAMIIKGVPTAGDIFDATSTSHDNTADVDSSIDSVTTTVEETLILACAGRGSDFAHTVWPNGPSDEWGPFSVVGGSAEILRTADPTNVEGSGTDAGGHLNGEIRAGTTGGSGGGMVVLSAIMHNAGTTGTFDSTLRNVAEEVYITLAIKGVDAEAPGDAEAFLTDCVVCRLNFNERVMIDSSRLLVLFDDGDGTWRDGTAKVRCDMGGQPFISVYGNDQIDVILEPANLMGHSDEAEISISTRTKVGV